MSNTLQLGQALRQYFDENQGFGLPISPNEYHAKWNLYVQPLLPYLKQAPTKLHAANVPRTKRLWICPGDSHAIPIWVRYGSSYQYPGPGAYISAPQNSDMNETDERYVPRRPDQWLRPSRDMLVADYLSDFHGGDSSSRSDAPLPSEASASAVKSYNIVMLDLHAETCSRDEIDGRYNKFDTYTDYVLYDDNPYRGTPIPYNVLP